MTKWKLDDNHKSLEFVVKHMMISKVKGNFKNFEAEIEGDPEDLTSGKVQFTVDTSSINTNNDDRDNHLRSADFFDVENYPHMTFQSTSIEKTGENEYDVTGNLTIRGTTKQETFKVTYEGSMTGPDGSQVIAFSAEGKVNRKDYGLTWNVALEAGGVLVGEEIKFNLETEAVKVD